MMVELTTSGQVKRSLSGKALKEHLLIDNMWRKQLI